MQESNDSPPRPSSVACLACRRRHVKCDALIPACTRCRTTNTECQYVRSRRGLRKHTRNTSSQPVDDNIFSIATDTFPEWLDATTLSPELDINATKALFQPLDSPTVRELSLPEDSLATHPDPQLVTSEVAFDPMIQLYYQNFHHSHPIMIPRKALNSICYLIPSHILSIMRYIGAHYHPNPSLKQAFRHAAFASLSDPTVQDGFKVQALLLLAIVDHFHCHEQNVHRLIQAAVNITLEIGLGHPCFATEHSYGHSVLEESWRRTYWELYVVEGLLAAMREQSSFRLYHQPANVQLPCAEKMYNCENVIPTGQTLEDLENNWTLTQDFSTFAYRISAVKKLGAVLELNRSLESCPESQVETIDAHLASSFMALPPLHGDGYDSSCHDEMIFQAQMTLYLALIYLHHPRSSMRFASIHTNPPTSCTRLKPAGEPGCELGFSQTLDLHSHKLLRAADLLSGLATLPSAIHHRSPFFTCALAICIIVHTAALLVVGGAGKEEAVNSRIQLSVGGLKVLGKIWPLASTVRQQMVGMYQEVVRK
ncbi:hypothetical protein BDW62DRAFT_16652 [Aspergillus aurantiobrunneus]